MEELNTSELWKTSATELLSIFREALVSLIPALDRARINWNGVATYDDWDNISESLFQNIVCATIYGEVLEDYKMAKYNFFYRDYKDVDYFILKWAVEKDRRLVFISFQSVLAPFDYVKFAIVNNQDEVLGHTKLRYDGLEFFLIKRENGVENCIDSFNVVL